MPRRCPIPSCPSRNYTSTVSFFNLPKTEAIALKWQEAILRNCGHVNLKKDARICQEHFRAGVDYDILPCGKPLRRQNAVPSIFPTQSTPCVPSQPQQPAAVAPLRDGRRRKRTILNGTPVASGRMKKGRLIISSREVLHDNTNCPRPLPTTDEWVHVDVSPVEVEVETTSAIDEEDSPSAAEVVHLVPNENTENVSPVVCHDGESDGIFVKVVSTPQGSRTVRGNVEELCNQSVTSPPTSSSCQKAETPDYVWHRPSRRKRDADETPRRHDHSYAKFGITPPRLKSLRRHLEAGKAKRKNLAKKLRLQAEKNGRLRTRVKKLQLFLKAFEKKQMPEKGVKMLTKFHSEAMEELIGLQKTNNLRPKEYSRKIKEFALLVHFYSPRAYRFLRRSALPLPAPSALRKWLLNYTMNPGFLSVPFQRLKLLSEKLGKPIYVCLMFDEIPYTL